MTGRLYIAGLDAFTKYGVVPLSYQGPVTWPALKPPEITEWPEEDGIRPDLTAPKIASREFDLQLGSASVSPNIGQLILDLSTPGYKTFNFAEIGLYLSIRMVGEPQYTRFKNTRVLSIRMALDSPLEGISYNEPGIAGVPEQGYQLDGSDLSYYGIRILQGTRDSFEKAPDTKAGLLIDEPSIDGMLWDQAQSIYFKSKPLTLKCLLATATVADFWPSYNALLLDLTKPGERVIISDTEQSAFDCYYNDSQIDRFEKTPSGGIWCEFTINLIATRTRPTTDLILWTTQKNELVTTNANKQINLSHDTHL